MFCFAGRGRQVIAVCKSADLLLMVLDASKPDFHRDILTRELESVGIRLNRTPPNIYFKKKKTGGISFNAVVPLTHLDEKMCQRILQVHTALMHTSLWCLAYLISHSKQTSRYSLKTLQAGIRIVYCLHTIFLSGTQLGSALKAS